MKFDPQSEQAVQGEAAKFKPWPNGVYDFEVAEAEEDVSKNGNDMIKLTLHVYNTNGDRRTVFDYLMPGIMYKLRHACYACGLGNEYESGDLRGVDFYGKTGRLKLGIQPEKDGYPAKNIVRDYIVEQSTQVAPKNYTKDIDDDIPF